MTYSVAKVQIDATVAGKRLGVSEASLALGVNAIPTITLICAPTEGRLAPLDPDVEAPDIRDILKLYEELQPEAEGLSITGDVHWSVKYDSGDTDEINLKGWILAEVGLSGFGATQVPKLFVVLKHKVCRLTKAGSIYETPKVLCDRILNANTIGLPDIIQITDKVYDLVNGPIEFWPPADNAAIPFRKRLAEKEAKLDTYFIWKNGPGEQGIFLGGPKCAPDKKPRLQQAIARYVLPTFGGTSTWDMLMGATGILLISVTQDDEHNYLKDKLVLEPTKPWKGETIVLEDYWCHHLDMPTSDPMRIAGVMCRKLGPSSDVIDLGPRRNGNMNMQKPTSEIMYKPEPAVPVLDGQPMIVNCPAIFDSGYRRDAPQGGNIVSMGVKSNKTRMDHYNKALKQYCQAMYEITACSMVRATARMVLSFKDNNGNLILPGNTCKFTASGEPLFYGYANSIVHYGSTGGGCETSVTMSYVRTDAPYLIRGEVAIADDSPNAAYI